MLSQMTLLKYRSNQYNEFENKRTFFREKEKGFAVAFTITVFVIIFILLFPC